MSRIIKFRLFNSEAMTMHYELPGYLEDGKDINDIFRFIDTVPELNLMQFTGLTDKNGVEIYEGDILRLKNSRDQTVNHQEIYWNNDMASFDWRTAGNDSWPDSFSGFIDDYEVIGNKWENPELLETKE